MYSIPSFSLKRGRVRERERGRERERERESERERERERKKEREKERGSSVYQCSGGSVDSGAVVGWGGLRKAFLGPVLSKSFSFQIF